MHVTLSGIVMVVKFSQPLNALIPMTLTPSGIVTLTKSVRPLKQRTEVTGCPSISDGMFKTSVLVTYPVISTFPFLSTSYLKFEIGEFSSAVSVPNESKKGSDRLFTSLKSLHVDRLHWP